MACKNPDSLRSTTAVPMVQPKGFLGCGIEFKELHEEQEARYRNMYVGAGERRAYDALHDYRDNFTEPGAFTHVPGFDDND